MQGLYKIACLISLAHALRVRRTAPTCAAGERAVGQQCITNVCVCNHGSPAEPCLTNQAHTCGSCDQGFTVNGDSQCAPVPCDLAAGNRMVNGTCTANVCQCDGGVAATGAACNNNDEENCASCDADRTQENKICRPTPVAAGGVTSCPDGWHMDGDKCAANECTCNNGKPMPYCDTNDAEVCMACDTVVGYHLENGLCAENQCSCNNGTAATGADCKNDGGIGCSACSTGFFLENSQCMATPSAAADTGCGYSKKEVNNECVPNVCKCENGNASKECENETDSNCEGCNPFFYLGDDQTCGANVCTCANGTAATTGCVNNNQPKCASCDAGFVAEGANCVPATR